MPGVQILPELAAGYFGQPAILEHLSVLLRWARDEQNSLPLLVFTGPRGQGQKVLAGLAADYLDKPLEQIAVLRSDGDRCFRITARDQVRRYQDLAEASRALAGDSLILLETHGPLSEVAWDEIVGALQAVRPKKPGLGNLIARSPNLECLPSDARFRCEAHFHFGPNTDEGEKSYLDFICQRDGIPADPEAIRAAVSVVDGLDWLGEKLLRLAGKYSRYTGSERVTAAHVCEVWSRWGRHLTGTMEPPGCLEREASV